MRPLDEIREALAGRERNRPKLTERPGRRRKGRPHTERTKAKLSERQRLRRRAEALQDPDSHELRLVRVNFGGTGLSIKQLSQRALVPESVITDIERGRRQPSRLTTERLARALKSTPGALGLE